MRIKGMKRLSGAWLLVLAGAAIATVGCTVDREVLQPVIGDTIFTFAVDAGLSAGLPAGAHAVTDLVADVDPTVSDAFGRATGAPVTGNFPYYFLGCCFFFDSDPILNSSKDGRLPALTDDDVEMEPVNAAAYILDPTYDWAGGGGLFVPEYDIWFILRNMPGNTRVVAGLVRYAMQVNGENDYEATLLGKRILQPDQLVLLGGSPGGDYTRRADLFNLSLAGGTPYPAEANANPYYLGYFQTSADGVGTLDVVVSAFDATAAQVFYSSAADRTQATSPVAPNGPSSFSLPNYNYLVFWETDGTGAPNLSRPIARVHMGVDLDPSGQPIRNAFSPFPVERLTPAEIAAAPGLINLRAREAMAMLSPLAELSGGSYQLWLYSEETSAILAARAERQAFEATETGPSLVATDTVTTFNSDPALSYTLRVNDGTLGADTVGYFTHLLVSIQPSGATSPSEAIPLFSQYVDQAGTPADFNDDVITANGTFRFGSFNPGGEPYVYRVAGLGRGGFYGDEVRVNYVNLPLPPAGYFYDGWLVDGSGAAVHLSPLTGPYPEYVDLSNVASTATLPDFVVEGVILRSTNRALASEQDPPMVDADGNPMWYNYATYHLTLSPVLRGGTMPPSTAMGGVVPDRVKARKPKPEQ